MKTKDSKTLKCFEKIFFVAIATIIFTLLMSVNSVQAEVTASWDATTETLSITGSGEITEETITSTIVDKTKIKTVTIEDGITSIGDKAFSGCSNLESINIPSSVTKIGSCAFNGCSTLKEITIPSNVISIGKDAFSGCNETTIYIPEGLAPPESTSVLEDLQYSYYKAATPKAKSGPVTSYRKNLSSTKEDPTLYKVTILSTDCDVTLVVVCSDDSDSGGYAINSGQSVPLNTKILVYATAKEGYEISNIQVTIIENEYDPGTTTTLNNGDSFTVKNNAEISATATKKLYVLTLSAKSLLGVSLSISQINLNGSTVSSPLQSIDYGSQVKLTAPETIGEYYFIGWFLNGIQAPSSQSTTTTTTTFTTTFTMYNNVSYEARYKDSNNKTVTFVANDQVIKVVETNNTIQEADIPTAPVYHGMQFDGWLVGAAQSPSGNVLNDVKQALQYTNTVTVTAKYKSITETSTVSQTENKFEITVQKKVGTADPSKISDTNPAVKESQWVTFNLMTGQSEDSIEKVGTTSQWNVKIIGTNFSHWDLDGEKISTNITVSFRIAKDCTLTAVCIAKPTAPSFELQRVTYESGTLILKADLQSLFRTLQIILVNKVAFQYGTESTLPEDSPSVLCEKTPNTEAVYVATIPANSDTSSITYYIKPIVIYTDSNGKLTSSEGSIQKADTSDECKSRLILEAKLTGINAADITVVKFIYGHHKDLTDSDPFILCEINHSKGEKEDIYTYVAKISSITFGTDYYIRSEAKLTDGTTVTGDTITVDPESGYDIDEKACAVIISSSTNTSGTTGATFVAYISIPTGSKINKAGVIATQAPNLDEILDFSTARYVKEWLLSIGEPGPLNYTWTKSSIESGKHIYVRPYVIYTKNGEKHTLIGKRVSI